MIKSHLRKSPWWIVLPGLLLGACSDDSTGQQGIDSTAPPADIAAEALVADAGGADQEATDHSAADAPADKATGDGTTPLPDMGPPPGFPKNLTQFINMGDSIAVGYGASAGLSYKELLLKNDNTTYPAYKGMDLISKFPKVKMVDTSKVGALSSDLATQTKSLTGNATGDTLVVISIGGNDFASALIGISLDPNQTKVLGNKVTANLKLLLDHFGDSKLYPNKVMIMLFLVHDPTDGMGTLPAVSGLVGFCTMIQALGGFVGPVVIKQLGLFNGIVRSYAQANKIHIVDNATHFLGHGYNCKDAKSKHYNAKDPTLWFYNDCLHLNDKGNNELRKLIWKRATGK